GEPTLGDRPGPASVRREGAELRRLAVHAQAGREHRLAAVLHHLLEVAALVVVAAVAVGAALAHAEPDLRRARHAGARDRAQLVERALIVPGRAVVLGGRIARPVGEAAGEEPDAHRLVGAR